MFTFFFSLGIDFNVWYFNKLVTIGDISSSFGIYCGGQTTYDNEEKPKKIVRDIVLSRIVKWRIHTEVSGKFDENSYAEIIILSDIDINDWYITYMHIFASPSSESDWKIIREMVHSLSDTKGTATLIIWVFYGIILSIVFLVILLIVRKRKKVRQLANKQNRQHT